MSIHIARIEKFRNIKMLFFDGQRLTDVLSISGPSHLAAENGHFDRKKGEKCEWINLPRFFKKDVDEM